MSKFRLVKFDVFIILTEINFNSWSSITKFGHESFNVLSLFIGNFIHLLVSTSSGIHECTSVVDNSNWIETIEERFEMSIFAVLANSGDSGSFWFVMGFDERFTNNEGIFLLFWVSLLTNPANDLFVELQDKAIIGIKMSSLERSLGDFSAGNLSSVVGDFEKSVLHVSVIFCGGSVFGGWVDGSWLSSKVAPEFLIIFGIFSWEEDVSVAMSLGLSDVGGDLQTLHLFVNIAVFTRPEEDSLVQIKNESITFINTSGFHWDGEDSWVSGSFNLEKSWLKELFGWFLESTVDTSWHVLHTCLLEIGHEVVALVHLLFQMMVGVHLQNSGQLDGPAGRGAHLVGGALFAVPVMEVVAVLVLLDAHVGVASVEFTVGVEWLEGWHELLHSVNFERFFTNGRHESVTLGNCFFL